MSPYRVPIGAAVFIAVVLGSVPLAAAQEFSFTPREQYRSARHWAMELKFGPYRPDIDSEFQDLPPEQRPHRKFFGNSRRLLAQMELDYQIFKGFGSLAVGLSVGYTKFGGKALKESAAGAVAEPSSDSTSLLLLPAAVSLVYRFDVLAHRMNIPLVPYVKGGVDWVYWSISDGNGRVARRQADEARGATTGFHGAVGLALLLDIFDAGAAQQFDAETGVNHTYLFGEFRHAEINGLGKPDKLHLGDTTWSAGLMFEF